MQYPLIRTRKSHENEKPTKYLFNRSEPIENIPKTPSPTLSKPTIIKDLSPVCKPSTVAKKVNKPCIHFNKGKCQKTEQECRYLHVMNDEKKNDEKQVKRTVNGNKVAVKKNTRMNLLQKVNKKIRRLVIRYFIVT